jgi:hypothetical protein
MVFVHFLQTLIYTGTKRRTTKMIYEVQTLNASDVVDAYTVYVDSNGVLLFADSNGQLIAAYRDWQYFRALSNGSTIAQPSPPVYGGTNVVKPGGPLTSPTIPYDHAMGVI